MRIGAIDPGLKGGVALLSEDEVLVEALPFKRVSGGHEFCSDEFLAYIDAWQPDVVAIEKPQARPRQNVVSIATAFKNYGIILGLMSSRKIRFEEISAKEWKRFLGLTKDKDQSIKLASILFPAIKFAKNEDGLAEALLIAEYRRQCG